MFLLPQSSTHPLLKSTLSRKSEHTVSKTCHLLNWRQVGKVEKLHSYPLTAGCESYCTTCIFTKENMTGVLNNVLYSNNSLLVYDYESNYIIYDYVKMRNVSVKYLTETELCMRSPLRPDLIIDLSNIVVERKLVNITTAFCQKFVVTLTGLDCGPEAAAWFSGYLNTDNARLAFMLKNYYESLSLEKKDLHLNKRQTMKNEENLIPVPLPVYSVMLCPLRDQCNNNITKVIEKYLFKPHIYIKTNHIRELHDWNLIMIGDIIMTNIRRCPRNFNWQNMTVHKLLHLLPLTCEVTIPGEVEVGDYVYIK